MENQDQNLNEDGTPKDQNLAGTAGAGDTKTPPEGFVSKEQFAASQAEAIKLAKELKELKTPPKTAELPEEKKKVFEAISEYEKQKVEETKKEDEQLKSDLDKLHSIHGEFDNKKLISLVDEYGVYDDEGNVKWEKAIELYKKLGNQVVKKPEIGIRTQDKNLGVEQPLYVKGKSMFQVIQDGLKRLGGS